MPGLDQTGPVGQGPMTGWKRGRCTNFDAAQKNQDSPANETPNENSLENSSGRGLGRGRGGRGRGGLGMGRQNRFRGGF